ncbi:MAG: ATP-binding cassette domain-containing protein [Oscillospiraceae bacterium]|jgi:peptide/nickel transport system ATP-binding protein|nr:ATP-binding cassette domain-containing protein [Oscillospiraceae bacterium]
MLEIKDAVRTFQRPGAKSVDKPLDGASMSIGDAEIVALMGNSGEGKSTIARLLCGTLRADSGTAHFGGAALFVGGSYNRSAGAAITLIPQQPYAAFDPRQKLCNAVAEPLLCRKIVKTRDEAIRRTAELFRMVSLDTAFLTRLPSQVSGGQAQRAAIARALGVGPRLLIADEATSMLDPASQDTVISLLKSLVRTHGISVLLISHDPELVKSAANRVYTLSGGKIYQIEKGELQ